MKFLTAALRYAVLGFAVFPAMPGGKAPLTPHGCYDASVDPDRIQNWWNRYPRANIGIATGAISGIVALDYDVKKSRPGLRTREELREKFGIRTLAALTPSGGIHEVFQYPGQLLRNTVDQLPGLDVRTDGGYIIAAPSIVDGVAYRWIEKSFPAVMPQGLIALLQRVSEPTVDVQPPRLAYRGDRQILLNRVKRYLSVVPPAISGQGGDLHTFRVCCRTVRGFGLSDAEAMEVLSDWNLSCLPPWSETQLWKKIASARKNGTEPVGGRLEVAF